MKNNHLSANNIKELFLKLYPVQFFTIFTSSFSSFANGLITGHFLSSVEMVALGLITPLTLVISALSTVVSSGAGILCGRYMGRGEGDKINKVFSISMISLFIVGVILSLACYVFAPNLALLFGSNNETLTYTTAYIRGLSIGFIPTLIVPCMMTFLQMSNKSRVSLISTLILATLVTSLGLVNVLIVKQGIFGMGLATSISQYIVSIIIIAYLLIKKNLFSFSFKDFNIKECLNVIVLGAPSSLASLLYAIRNVVINSTALGVGGIAAVNALAILGSMNCFIDTFNISLSSTITMLVSVSVGEKDTASIKAVGMSAIKVGEVCALTKLIIFVLFGESISILFGATADVIVYIKDLLLWYNISAFVNTIQLAINNTYAAEGKTVLCTAQVLSNCLIVPFICLFISKTFGIVWIWMLYTLAEIVSLIMFYLVACVKNKTLVTKADQLLYLDEVLDYDGSHSITINHIDEVANISLELQKFCESFNIDGRRAKLVGLCVEELTANIIECEFGKDKKENTIDIFATVNNDEVSVRLRDNCVPFDPHSKLGMEGKDITDDIGIKMVAKIAKEMNYQITFGMNILTIKL